MVSPTMKISAATPADVPQLCELLSELFSQEREFQPNRARQAAGLLQIISQPQHGKILVIRDGDSIVGMANVLFTISTALGGKVGILEDLIVHASHRGNGAGSLLLRGAMDAARAAGCRRLTLLTDISNEPARRFYRRHGFLDSNMKVMRLPL